MNGYHTSVFVKHYRGRTYHAFWDTGWEQWTSFLVRRNEVIYIKGQEIDNKDKKMLLAAVKELTDGSASKEEA